MAKISMKVGNTNETANRTMKGIRREKARMQKSKVKKYNGPNLIRILDAIDGLSKEERLSMNKALREKIGYGQGIYQFMDELVNETADIMDGMESLDVDKSIKTLKSLGYTIYKGDEEVTEETVVEEPIEETVEEETADEEEASEEEETVEDEDADVEVDVDVEKNMTLKSAVNVLKQRGWIKGIQKEDGAGMKADDVKQFVQNQSKKNPVPADDVGDAKTGIPEDVPESEGEENDDLEDDEGGSIEALLNPDVKNIDISQFGLEDDDLDVQEAIDKRRMQKDSEARGLPAMMASQPYANNYRTTQQGEGKVDVRTMLNATPKTNKTWRV